MTQPDLINRFEQMLASGKETALLRFSLGNEYLKRGEPARAAEHLRRAVELDPKYSAAWKILGKALADAGQAEQALAAYRQGICGSRREGRQAGRKGDERVRAQDRKAARGRRIDLPARPCGSPRRFAHRASLPRSDFAALNFPPLAALPRPFDRPASEYSCFTQALRLYDAFTPGCRCLHPLDDGGPRLQHIENRKDSIPWMLSFC